MKNPIFGIEINYVHWMSSNAKMNKSMFKMNLSVTVKMTTVKLVLEAAASIVFEGPLLQPIIKGGYYLKAASIDV